MADATLAQIKARAELLAASISGIASVLTGSESSLTSYSLPAVEIRIGGSRRNSLSSDLYEIEREIQYWVFVSAIEHPDDESEVLAALEAVYPLLDAMSDYLMDRPRLQSESGDNGLVDGLVSLDDSGAGVTPYREKQYAAGRVRAVYRQQRYIGS